MCDCWFVQYPKTSQDKTIAEIKVAVQPTGVKVANQYAHSKATAQEVPLWNYAANKVITYVNTKKDPRNNTDGSMVADKETDNV